jgi:hypothetical protein
MIEFLRPRLAEEAVSLLVGLRRIRNQSTHASDFELEPEQAVRFGQLVERLPLELLDTLRST